jgi:hypothetical protein
MCTRLLDFGGVRLVINQSIILVEWSLQPKIGVSFRCLLAKFVFSILICYGIKHLSYDITLICSHIRDLTSWTHIWCVSGFVLKTRYYIELHIFLDPQRKSWNLIFNCSNT